MKLFPRAIVVEKEGNYILALRDNHPNLLADIRMYAEEEVLIVRKIELKEANLYFSKHSKGHGRIEQRECWLLPDLSWLDGRQHWAGLSGAALIRSTRTLENGMKTVTDRYYPCLTAERVLKTQQDHWSIENNLHWMLDVLFHEDDTHVRLGHAAVVLNMLRKMTLQLLKADTSHKESLASKRLRCAWVFLMRSRFFDRFFS